MLSRMSRAAESTEQVMEAAQVSRQTLFNWARTRAVLPEPRLRTGGARGRSSLWPAGTSVLAAEVARRLRAGESFESIRAVVAGRVQQLQAALDEPV